MHRHICVGVHIGHDRSVSVVEDGVLVAHLAEERLDRIKYSPSVSFPRQSLTKVLHTVGCSLRDVQAFGLSYAFVDMARVGDSLAEDFRAEFGLSDTLVFPMGHHLAHAYSTFFTSPFSEATVLVADGAGDLIEEQLESETAYHASQDGFVQIWARRQDIPLSYAERRNFFRLPYMPKVDYTKCISLARKYEQITYALDFGWGQSGKTMGLAAYGTPMFPVPNKALAPPDFPLTMSDLLTEIHTLHVNSGMPFGAFIRQNRQDIAATIQAAVETLAVSVCRHVRKLSPSSNLCLAGGLFLNCVLNHAVIRNSGFDRIHIVPACGDDGQSIGAAYFASECSGGKPIPAYASPYQGPMYPEHEIWSALEAIGGGARARRLDAEELIRAMVERLAAQRTIGLLRGRSEMGPRALGHRSILASCANRSMREHLNRYVKHREDFRPFAPIVRWEDQFTMFDLATPSPHMLMAASVRPEWRERIAAVVHADNTARVQAVRQEDEPFLYDLLTAMGQATGVPVLLNTSFNLRGEPIIETPADALSTFYRSNLDSVVLEKIILDRD